MKKILVAVLIAIFTLAPVTYISEPPHVVISETYAQVIQEKTFDAELHTLSLKYGQDEATARAIIQCESQGRESAKNLNFEASSTIPWSKDIGWWQINDYYHQADALKKGFDITDKWQNLEYGFILLTRSGTQPWSASRSCWSKLI